MSKFTIATGPLLATALLFGVPFVLPSATAAAPAQTLPATTTTAPADTPADAARTRRAHERSEARIAKMHQRLHLTAAQEPLWTNVAQMMRDNATTFSAKVPERSKDATAVENLKTFEIMAEEHAAGLKKLIPAFEKLYADLTPEQRKHADLLFGRHERNKERN